MYHFVLQMYFSLLHRSNRSTTRGATKLINIMFPRGTLRLTNTSQYLKTCVWMLRRQEQLMKLPSQPSRDGFGLRPNLYTNIFCRSSRPKNICVACVRTEQLNECIRIPTAIALGNDCYSLICSKVVYAKQASHRVRGTAKSTYARLTTRTR